MNVVLVHFCGFWTKNKFCSLNNNYCTRQMNLCTYGQWTNNTDVCNECCNLSAKLLCLSQKLQFFCGKQVCWNQSGGSYLRTEFPICINIASRGDDHKPSQYWHGVHIIRSRNVLSLSMTLHWSSDTEWRYFLYEATRLFIVIVNSEPLKLYTTAVCNRLFSFVSHSLINFTTVLYSIFNRIYMNTHCVINMCHTPNL